MRVMDDFSLEVEALKAIVRGLVSVLQDDPKALEKAKKAALSSLKAQSNEDLNLLEKHVALTLSPKLYKTPEEMNQ